MRSCLRGSGRMGPMPWRPSYASASAGCSGPRAPRPGRRPATWTSRRRSRLADGRPSPGQRQAVQSVDRGAVPEFGLAGQAQSGKALQERWEGHAHLDAGQGRAEAVVDAVAEGQVRGRGAGDVEDVAVL